MNKILQLPSLLIASVLGTGFFPVASGTFASALAVLCWSYFIWPLKLGLERELLYIVLLTLAGVVSSNILLREKIRQSTKSKASDPASKLSKKYLDPSFVVVDEWIGMWITLLGVRGNNWTELLVAFLLFRIFDVTKLGPISSAEKLPLGWGIMSDDVVAGVCSLITLIILQYLLPNFFITL